MSKRRRVVDMKNEVTEVDRLKACQLLEKNVSVVEHFFAEDDWHCRKEVRDEVVIFRGGVAGFSGMYSDYAFLLVVGSYDIQCYATFPANLKDAVTKVAELIARINYQIKYGGFELNCDNGELRFHICVPAVAVRHDSFALMRFLMLTPVQMLDRYAKVITAVLVGSDLPKSVLDSFESTRTKEVADGK